MAISTCLILLENAMLLTNEFFQTTVNSMPTKIKLSRTVLPNYLTWCFRVVLFAVIAIFYVFFIFRIVKRGFDNDTGSAMFGLLFVGFLLIYLALSILGIFKVKYDEESGEIQLHRL